MHVKKGQTVVVICGNDKGRTGEVKAVDHKRDRVLVDGVNLRWRHKKATQSNPQGAERVQEACPIHASNVMRVDAETGKGVRGRKKGEGRR